MTTTELAAFRITSGGVGLITAATAVLVLLGTAYFTAKRQRQEAALKYRLQQVNELYAPVRLLLDENRRLVERLREGKPAGFHVLDNVPSLKAAADDAALVEEILAVDKQIDAVLRSKGGLVGSPWPPSFAQFLTHYATLRRIWNGGTAPADPDLKYFPKAFEDDVVARHDKLIAEIEKAVKL